MSHRGNNFWLDSEALPSTPKEAKHMVEFCQIGRCISFYSSLLTNSLYVAFHVCVSFFLWVESGPCEQYFIFGRSFYPNMRPNI